MHLLTNATLATMTNGYGLIENGAVLIDGSQIAWCGATQDAPNAETVEDCAGRLITPGLIDSHTHIVHGGHRAGEFEQRLKGASYEEISKAGGGIASTMQATKKASEAELLQSALPRIDALIAEGVCTVEIKSGYGLDFETEAKMLRVARQIADIRPITVKTSFLGAHATPKGHDPDHYIREVCLPSLEAAHDEGLVDAVDGFCEGIAFTPEQIAPVFDKAQALGLPVKLHAEQLSNIGGAKLAAQYCALSADHLEYATSDDAKALAEAGTVAVLLPGAFYTLRESSLPPIEAFRAAGTKVALATDCNPGSSPLTSLLLAMNMGCTLFRLTPEEALIGVTRNAAKALDEADVGTIEPGKRADLAIWNVTEPAELAYRIGFNPLFKRIFGGIA